MKWIDILILTWILFWGWALCYTIYSALTIEPTAFHEFPEKHKGMHVFMCTNDLQIEKGCMYINLKDKKCLSLTFKDNKLEENSCSE